MFNRQRIEDLEEGLSAMELAYGELSARVRSLESVRPDNLDDATVVIDWDTIKVFSIERLIVDTVPNTCLGYLLNGEAREWYVACSYAQHEKLVREYKAHLLCL